METINSTEPKIEQGLELSELSISFLRETAKWARFLAIIGFICVAFMVVFALSVGAIFSAMATLSPEFSALAAMPWIYSVVYLLLAVVYAFPAYFLYKFSADTRVALEMRDSALLETGLRFLKSHYKFIGIMTIVIVVLYALLFVGVAVAVIAALALS